MTPMETLDSRSTIFRPPAKGLHGSISVPGDKSISHRALMIGAVCSHSVPITGLLHSADTMATLAAIRALGVEVDVQDSEVVVHGLGWDALREPDNVIDVGNSGTTMRLLPGLVASCHFLCVLTGDSSIRKRPMARIIRPLAKMGAAVSGRAGDTLPPITVRGASLTGVKHVMPVASAQVKSCILLAALRAWGDTTIQEPGGSRDHTERMLGYAGATLERDQPPHDPGTVYISTVDELTLPPITIPGDISSAAFFLVAALLTPGSEVTVREVGLNPTRVGLLTVLQRMGANIDIQESPSPGPEPIGQVTARYSELQATDVEPLEVPGLIDELPLFLLCAAKASGVSVVRGAEELRVKESDRLAAMTAVLQGLRVDVVEHPDGLQVTGSPEGWSGGVVDSRGDHRLAMVGAVAGAASSEGVTVDGMECASVSFPDFEKTLTALGGECVSIQSPHPSDKRECR